MAAAWCAFYSTSRSTGSTLLLRLLRSLCDVRGIPAGLPTLKASAGFRVYDEFEDEFYFEYPKVTMMRPWIQ